MTPASRLENLLALRHPPIAISFVDAPPTGVPHVDEVAAASCAYWRVAAETRRAFYTTAEDHHRCPVGAHTHGVDLPAAVATELQGLVGQMIGLEYLAPEEVAGIPRRPSPLRVAVYAPLADAPVAPSVVLVRADVRQLMLAGEAARSAGLPGGQTFGRPTCVVLPVADAGQAVSSTGCIGNRVYTGLGDGEGWFAIPGARLADFVARLEVVAAANRTLEAFHRERLAAR